jgi:hypothetical protein
MIQGMTKDEVRNIPESLLPMPVLSSSGINLFSFGIRAVKKTQYSHFMWMHRPGFFASQSLWFKEIPVDTFMDEPTEILKFWLIDSPPHTRKIILDRINFELKKPWWKTRYDVLAIIGQMLRIPSLQVPWMKICSEHAHYLSLVDSRYDLDRTCPAPNEVNEWLKKTSGYNVYGIYSEEE